MKKILILCCFILFSITLKSQSKEYEKLKDLVDKGKLEKAQEYCDKATVSMDAKASGKMYALMGLGYYNQKNYPKAAENLLRSEDTKISVKVAKEYENSKNDFYDLKMAGRLYRVAKDYQRAAELLFQEEEYEEAANICPSASANLKFGKQLFEQGKYKEATAFFKRAKVKGQKFSDDEVLNYYYKNKNYKTAHSIQDYGEGSFSLNIQGTVIDKMVENGEPMPFIYHFLDSINVKGTKQIEAIINAMVNNQMTDQVETYCLTQKGTEQQVAFAFLAQNASSKNLGLSAWANLKAGKTLIGKQQLTSYLIETARSYNSKWEKEPVSQKIVQEYIKETKPVVASCELNYCEVAGFASTMARSKGEELAKTNSALSVEYSKSFIFIKTVEKYCK